MAGTCETRWILESNSGENAAEFQRFRSSDFPLHQPLGERTIKKQRGRKDNNSLQRKYGKHCVAPPDGHLRQSAQSLRSSGGCDLIAELPVGQRAPGKSVASGQLDKQEILTQPPLAELQANEERQGNPLQEYEQRFEKVSEDQKLSRLGSEAGLRLVEVGQFFQTLPSPRGEANLSLCREYALPRDRKGTKIKGWIESDARFVPVSDIKVCKTHGRYSVEVQVQSLFKDQTESWIRNVNGVDKFVREAMPIQEEEKASGRPAAKARSILKPSSTSGWDTTPMKQRQWIDIEIQESKAPHCFHVSKFSTRLL